MKRLMIACSMLLVILTAGTCALLSLGSTSERIAAGLESAASLASSDPAAAQEQLLALRSDWETAQRWIGSFVREDPLETISSQINRCHLLLAFGMKEEFSICARQAAFSLRSLFRQELPTLQNIL